MGLLPNALPATPHPVDRTETETAATTSPAWSRTGADTLATPASRSAALWAQPRRRTSASVRSVNFAEGNTARCVAASLKANRLCPDPAVMAGASRPEPYRAVPQVKLNAAADPCRAFAPVQLNAFAGNPASGPIHRRTGQ